MFFFFFKSASPFPSLLIPVLFYIFNAFHFTYFCPAGFTFYSLLGKFAFFPLWGWPQALCLAQRPGARLCSGLAALLRAWWALSALGRIRGCPPSACALVPSTGPDLELCWDSWLPPCWLVVVKAAALGNISWPASRHLLPSWAPSCPPAPAWHHLAERSVSWAPCVRCKSHSSSRSPQPHSRCLATAAAARTCRNRSRGVHLPQ